MNVRVLQDRAHMLRKARSFFDGRGVLETDCPIISPSAAIDVHIDLIPALDVFQNKRYLHSSPEYGMKRLLAEGIGDIYQLSHVFRQGELGHKHNPEFMMAEWYRCAISFEEMIKETFDFIRLFLGDLSDYTLSYREALLKYTGIDYVHATETQLLEYLKSRNVTVYDTVAEEGKDALLNLILGLYVEPELGRDSLCALAYYPASQAALAQTIQRGEESAAERFEVYYQGIELANGYHELADSSEQRKRLMESNRDRVKMGKEELPVDERFLEALEKGLPECCGVAVGFDRLMMLRHGAAHIEEVIPFSWDFA